MPPTPSRGPLLAALDRPRTPRPTTLAVVADAHVTPTEAGTWKVLHRAADRFRAAVADIGRRDVDAVLFAGDLTKDGAPAEYALVDEVLEGLDAPLVAVPGNHDVPKPRWDPYDAPDAVEFARRYAPVTYPFVKRVGGLDLVCLNSASAPDGSLSDTHEGCVGAIQRRWLDHTLPELEAPVVALHHPVTRPDEHSDGFPDSDLYQVRDARALRRILASHDAPLVVSGHLHWPAVAPLAGGHELVAPATCSFPQAYCLVHVRPGGTRIELVPLADRAGLEEAYVHAREGRDGRGLAARADPALLDALLLAEEGAMRGAGRPPVREGEASGRSGRSERRRPGMGVEP